MLNDVTYEHSQTQWGVRHSSPQGRDSDLLRLANAASVFPRRLCFAGADLEKHWGRNSYIEGGASRFQVMAEAAGVHLSLHGLPCFDGNALWDSVYSVAYRLRDAAHLRSSDPVREKLG
eukprot:9482876-Alexandrium_andersonii.AAC.1